MARAPASHPLLLPRLLMCLALLVCADPVRAASSILIWPINPVMEAEQKAVALWLENRGQQPVSLQIRVMNWQQSDYADQLQAQRAVISSPPVVSVEPGKRQMIRLMSMQAPPPGVQRAFRVLVDEMLDPEAPSDPRLGVKFQMRYSVPLFVFGQGSAPARADGKSVANVRTLSPNLHFEIQQQGSERYLLLNNDGQAHARLSKVSLRYGNSQHLVADGLLGYVLAGARMRWPLPEGVPLQGIALEAIVNEQDAPQPIAAR